MYTNVYTTYTHCRGRFIVPAYYGIHAADCPRTPTFTHVHPLWCVIAFIQFGMDGRDKSAPTPTECMLRIVHVHQLWCVVAFIQFGMDGRDESAPYAYGMYAADCPRLPTVGADLSCPHITEYTLWITVYNQCLHHEHVIFTHVHQHLPTCTHCRGRFIVPAYHGMYAAIVYVQPMFTPRTRNIYPRTPTFTPTFTHVHPL